MPTVDFFVPGKAIAQPRAHKGVSKKTGKAYGFVPSEHKIHNWRDSVKWAAYRHRVKGEWPLQKPISVTLQCVFVRLRPKSTPKAVTTPITKPDLKNLVWGVEDAMDGVVFEDDSQVVSYAGSKKMFGAQPGVHVTVTWGEGE